MEKLKPQNITETPEQFFEKGTNPFLSAVMGKIRREYELGKQEGSPAAGVYYIASRYAGAPYRLPFIFFETKGCKFDKAGACTMCNFGRNTKYTESQTAEAVEPLIETSANNPFIEIIPSGSLLDDWEVSPGQRRRILEMVAAQKFETVGTESRAEFITEEKIAEMKEILGDDITIEMGIGLETTDPIISKYSINKIFSPEKYKNAVSLLKKNDIEIFSHALLKPAFLTEYEAYEDTIKTIKWSLENGSDFVGIAAMNLKKGTLNDWLAERGEYRVPWLWTIVKILKDLPEEIRDKVTVFGFESGDSTPIEQEAMNCAKCSPNIKRMIVEYIGTRKPDILDQIDRYECSCRTEWENEMKKRAEPLSARLPAIYKSIASQLNIPTDDSSIQSLIEKSLPKKI